MIKEFRFFFCILGYVNFLDWLDVIVKNKCLVYMFKLLRLVNKLFLFESYFVFIVCKDFLFEESVELKLIIYFILK